MVADRQSLLDEFNRVIGPQKAAIAARLPSLFSQFYQPPADLAATAAAAAPAANGADPGAAAGPPGAAPGGGAGAGGQLTSKPSGKRAAADGPGAGPAEGHKRVKAPPSAADREEEVWKALTNLINKKLKVKKEFMYFKEPVDIVKLKIPDYYNYVKRPMDLGTVLDNLAKRVYKTPLDACSDVRQVWINCSLYNQPNSYVRKAGDMMADIWEKAWLEAGLEKRWADIQISKDPTNAVPLRMAHLSSELKSAVNQVPQSEQQAAAAGTGGPALSDLQKRLLSIQLAELQGEQLAALLTIIQPDLPPAGPDDEVEVDIDALPLSTLQKMQQYVNTLMGRAVPSGAQAPASAPAPAQPAVPSQPVGQQGAGHHAVAPAGAPVIQPGGPAGLGASGPGTIPPAQHAGSEPPQGHGGLPGSMQPPGAGNEDTDTGLGGSSGHGSPALTGDSHEEVKGSTLDDPHKDPGFAWANPKAVGVDESATAPNATSSILRDKGAARKTDVQVNVAAWDVNSLQPEQGEADGDEEGAEDEMWVNFKSKEEQKRQQAEEQRKLKEQQEEELRKKKESEEEEARRQAEEAAARERELAEAEARAAEAAQRARMEQCDKEVDEIKARQGTANLVQRDDIGALIGTAEVAPEEALANVGLTFKDDDEDMVFDEED